MKRNITILAILLGSAVLLLCWLCLTDNNPVKTPAPTPKSSKVESPPPYVPTPEENERWDYTVTLLDRLPYTSFYTFGMASKLCDWVVVGTVEEATHMTEFAKAKRPKANYAGENFIGYRVVLSVDRSLYGKTKKKMTFIVPHGDDNIIPESIEQRDIKPGDRMLVFLTDKWYEITDLFLSENPELGLTYLDFDKAKAERQKLDKLYSWSHLILDNKTVETEAVRAAEAYIDFFGKGGKRNRDTYHELLCSLFQTPVQRIRDDAERDIKWFYVKDAPKDIDKLLNDDRVRKEMKDYFRFRFRNEKPEEEK